jgi:hypothetical protein
MLIGLKFEFSKRDIYTFSFANDKELKFFIENLNVHLPESFISLLYDSIVNPSTGKLNFVLLKKFIDVCTDTVLQEEKTSSKTMRALLQNVPEEDSEIIKKFSGEIEKKLSERYSSL